MPGGDTSIGGGRTFPQTTWGMLSRLRPESGDFGAGLEQLCRRYWRPIYRHVRVAWSKSNEDAKDLTQAFLAWVLAERPLDSFEPSRGSFRAFLKTLLRRFVGHEERALQTLKRGGDTGVVALEDPAIGEERFADDGAQDPETLFDRAWRSEIVNRALDRVRETFESSGRASHFEIYQAYDLAAKGARPTYGELGTRHGMTAMQIEVRLCAVREELRKAIRAELAETTTGDAGIEDEWNALFGTG